MTSWYKGDIYPVGVFRNRYIIHAICSLVTKGCHMGSSGNAGKGFRELPSSPGSDDLVRGGGLLGC